MKNKLRVICINVAIFAIFWIGAEFLLHVAGVDTLYEMERKSMDQRFLSVCQRIRKEKLVVYDAFFTDQEAIFKANPKFDFNILFPRNGRYTINAEGFRGNEFKREDSGKTTILLVGDSFVWGYGAKPIRKSFTDLLQDAGYHAYNGGIPGTDALQYLKIVKKYVPLLKPKIVAICMFLGNDFNATPHPVQDGKRLHFISNFGFLLGYDNRSGRYFRDAGESFSFLKKRYCGCFSSPQEYFLYRTILGRLAYAATSRKAKMFEPDTGRKWIWASLKQMRRICEENGAAFMVFLIPTPRKAERAADFAKANAALFNDFHWHYPRNLKMSDYHRPPDGHFNNQGHRKFADLLIQTLVENGYFPMRMPGAARK